MCAGAQTLHCNRRMLAGCEEVELAFAQELYAPWKRLSHVYFPTRGFISLIMPINGSAALEVGLVGNDGMLGIPFVLGLDVSPVRAIVQGAGPALRMAGSRDWPCATVPETGPNPPTCCRRPT